MFWDPIQDTTLHLVGCFLRLLLVVIVSKSFLALMTLTVLRSTSKVFCRMSFHWDFFPHVLLMIRLGLWVSGRKATTQVCHFDHLIQRVHSIIMSNYCCCQPWSPCWCSVAWVSVLQSYTSSFAYCPLWKEVLCKVHT